MSARFGIAAYKEVQFLDDAVHRVRPESYFERPSPGIFECPLVLIEDVCSAAASSVLEEFVNRFVKRTVEYSLEPASGVVELL